MLSVPAWFLYVATGALIAVVLALVVLIVLLILFIRTAHRFLVQIKTHHAWAMERIENGYDRIRSIIRFFFD